MAKFLNTSGINYHLEEIIKGARDRLIIMLMSIHFSPSVAW